MNCFQYQISGSSPHFSALEKRRIFNFVARGTPEYFAQSETPDDIKAATLRGKLDPLVKQGAVFELNNASGKLEVRPNFELDPVQALQSKQQIAALLPELQAASPEVSRLTFMRIFDPEALQAYNEMFSEMKGKVTPDAVRRLHSRYGEIMSRNQMLSSGASPVSESPADLEFLQRWRNLLDTTPLGQVLQQFGSGNDILNNQLLNPVNEAMETDQPDVHKRLRELQLNVAEGKGAPLENLEDLPWYMKIAAAIAALIFAKDHSGIAAALVGGDILARITVDDRGLLGIAQEAAKSFSAPVGRPIIDELDEMYTSMDTHEREKSAALAIALDVSAGDVADYINTVGIKNLKTSPEKSFFEQRIQVLRGFEKEDPELKFLSYNLKQKGVNALNMNESLYDALVFVGNGDPAAGLQILENDRDGKNLGYYIWKETQQRVEQGQSNVLERGVEYGILGLEWVVDPQRRVEIKNALQKFGSFIIDITKDGAIITLNLIKTAYQKVHGIIMVPKAGSPGQYEFRFKSNLIHLKSKAFDTLEDALEFIGIGRAFDLNEVPFAPAGRDEYDSEIKSQIEAMQYDQDFYEAMKSMIEFMPDVDESHAFHIGGIMLQEDIWKWLFVGSSGTVDENMWAGIFRTKGKELLMVHGQMVEKRMEYVGNMLSGPFSAPADVVAVLTAEHARLRGKPEEAQMLEYLNAAKREAALPSATWESVVEAVKARVGTLATQDFKKYHLIPFKTKFEELQKKVREGGGKAESWWIFHLWDNTFGSLDQKEVRDIVGIPLDPRTTPLIAVSTLARTAKDATGKPLEISGVTPPITYEQKASELVSRGIYQIFSGAEWWDTLGMRNRGEYGAKLRTYAVQHYLRFVASMNEESTPNPDQAINYLTKLNAHFLNMPRGEAITKPVIDDFVSKIRTFQRYSTSGDKQVYDR